MKIEDMSYEQVFPTGVGMARLNEVNKPECGSVPHGCGDGPDIRSFRLFHIMCSPRVWGWPD